MEVFIGTILPFGFNFAPVNWAQCNGQLLSISQNAALFSLLGTTYGGDGISNLRAPGYPRPHLRRAWETGPGLPNYVIGQLGGQENASLLQSNIPQHTHQLVANAGLGTTDAPAAAVPAAGGSYTASGDGTQMVATSVNPSGSSIPVPTLPPYLVVNWCIALTGIFPSQG